MKTWLKRTAPVAVTALLISGAAYANSAPNAAREIRLLDVADLFEFVDVGTPAAGEGDFSPGDMLIFENNLRNRADTMTLGRFVGICTMAASPAIGRCSGSVILEKGKIELATTVDFTAADRIVTAVTGGTGIYRLVRGQAVFGEPISETTRPLTIKLAP